MLSYYKKLSHLEINYRQFRLDCPSRGGGLITLLSNKFCHKARLCFKLLSAENEILAAIPTLPGGLKFSLLNAYFPLGVLNTQ